MFPELKQHAIHRILYVQHIAATLEAYLDGAENTQCGQLQTHFSLRALHPSERHGHQILHKYPGAKHMWMCSNHNALHEAHHVFIQHALHVPRIAPRRKIKNHVFNLMVFWPHWPPN